jgi:hypothetical protein
VIAFASRADHLHVLGHRWPRKLAKPVREMIVYQYLLPTSLLVTGEAGPYRHFLTQLEATGDDKWDALLGHRFV